MPQTVAVGGNQVSRAASQHVKSFMAPALVDAVLVDQDDPRFTHQPLSEKHLVTDG